MTQTIFYKKKYKNIINIIEKFNTNNKESDMDGISK